jgi:light-regulated signal transduction histidine kinase (bacteriophytochrome)
MMTPPSLSNRAWRPMLGPSTGVIGELDVSRHRQQARVAQLERRVAELERNDRELATFAADVVHDLRSALQAVTGFAELLARREGARLDETSQGFLAHVLNAAGGMGELVKALLDHHQSSFAALAPTWVDGNDLVGAV